MIGYAEYIWPCYIFAFCLLGVQVVSTVIAWKKACKKISKLEQDKRTL